MHPPNKPLRSGLEERFVTLMIEDPSSPTDCARRAGYAEQSCAWAAATLMERSDVVSDIADGRRVIRDQVARNTGVRLADVVGLIWQLATVDIADFYDEDGNVKPIHEIPEHARLALESMDTEEVFEGRGHARTQVATVKKMRLAKRGESLDKMMKHLGGYELDNRQQMEPLVQLLDELSKRGANTLKITRE